MDKDEDDNYLAHHYNTIAALCTSAAVVGYTLLCTNKSTGVKQICCQRIAVQEIFRELGTENVCHAFRMTEHSLLLAGWLMN